MSSTIQHGKTWVNNRTQRPHTDWWMYGVMHGYIQAVHCNSTAVPNWGGGGHPGGNLGVSEGNESI